MPRQRFTKDNVDKWIRERTSDPAGTMFFDTKNRGLGLRVRPTGKATFFVEYARDGKRHRMTLGDYGTLTIEEAVNKARQELGKVAKGGDPLQEKKATRGIPTVKEWVASYLKDAAARKKSWKEDERYLGLLVTRCGTKRLDKVTAGDVRAIVSKLANDEKPIAANRALASMRTCLQRAWVEVEGIPENPAKRIQPDRRAEDAGVRDRVLSDDELKRMAEAVAAQPDPFVRAAFLVLAETGLRVSEALRVAWFDVDLEGAILHLPLTKAGKRQSIPLSPAVVDYLKTLPKRGPWVFPGRKSENHRTSLRKPWEEVREKAKFPDVHLHDLRRTFGLDIAKRAGLHIAQLLLRHSDIRVTQRVYAPFGLDDLRGALTEGGRVIPLVRKSEEASK